jgi:hypothetical protein
MVFVLMVVWESVRVKNHARRGITPARAGAQHTERASRENKIFQLREQRKL